MISLFAKRELRLVFRDPRFLLFHAHIDSLLHLFLITFRQINIILVFCEFSDIFVCVFENFDGILFPPSPIITSLVGTHI